jgi:tripartite-type tricarboxylate transporter receptor subunit TctC
MVAPLGAQNYPNKPIYLILPFAPSGGTDVLGRIIGSKLAERLGQPAVPENRPGAGGNVGLEVAARARPDGYTIVLGNPALTISPSLYKKLNFDPLRDFTPISLVAQIPLVMVVHPSLPVKTLKEFVEYARANPGKLNFGSAGIGNAAHLAGELLKSLTKIDMVHVAYKGGGPALMGLVSGEIGMMAANAAAAIPQVQAGKLRALAVLSNERLPLLPNVPTAKEAGIDNFEVTLWYGLLAPAGTPRSIVNRLKEEWIRIEAMPDTREQLQKAGFETLSSTPEQFSEFLKAEILRWGKVIREAKIPSLD